MVASSVNESLGLVGEKGGEEFCLFLWLVRYNQLISISTQVAIHYWASSNHENFHFFHSGNISVASSASTDYRNFWMHCSLLKSLVKCPPLVGSPDSLTWSVIENGAPLCEAASLCMAVCPLIKNSPIKFLLLSLLQLRTQPSVTSQSF